MKIIGFFSKVFLLLCFLLPTFILNAQRASGLVDGGCGKLEFISCNQTVSGNTFNSGNSYIKEDYVNCHSTRSSFNGNDKVYKLIVSSVAEVRLFNLSTDLDLFVLSDCDFTRATCTAKSTNSRGEENIRINRSGTYYLIVDGSFSSQNGSFSLEVSCPQPPPPPPPNGGCQDFPSNCQIITCTPRPPTGGGGGGEPTLTSYRCDIDVSYSGSERISHYEIDGQRVNRTSSNVVLTSRKSGPVVICVYYFCNGRLFKCCRVVTCPSGPENGCGGSCSQETFSSYSEHSRIAQQSSKWSTWGRNQAGGRQDAYVYRTSSGNKMLQVKDENSNGSGYHDVVYNLGNKRSGTHCLSMSLWVASGKTAYYNIQSSTSNRVGGGYWKIFFSNGTAKVQSGNTTYATFSYQSGKWMEIEMKFDLDNNQVAFYCDQNGRLIGSKTLNYNGNINLGGINYYAVSNARYYVDDIKLNCGGGRHLSSGTIAFRNSNKTRSKNDIPMIGENDRKAIDQYKKPFLLPQATKPVPVPKSSEEGPIEK